MESAVGRIFNIQRFSLDDGDGIRTLVFLKGCPLRCKWCHNAESWSSSKEIIYNVRSCISCRMCQSVCKSSCHDFADNHAFFREKCVMCGNCAEICPTGALKIAGEDMTAAECLMHILRDRDYFGVDGGVTLSGGEPMMQAEFCIELASLAKKAGIKVALETSGFCDTAKLIAIKPYVDQFLFDCKAAKTHHKLLTGVDDDLIIKNLAVLCENGATVELRCPIVPGANLCEEFIEKIAALANSYRSISCVALLPYHKTGLEKSSMLGKASQRLFTVPERDTLEGIKEYLAGKIKQKIIIK